MTSKVENNESNAVTIDDLPIVFKVCMNGHGPKN